jgi:hypothetical protein
MFHRSSNEVVTDMNPREVKLTSGQKEKLLRNIWLLHDGRWFLKSAEELGFEAATRLNLTVARSIGKTEIKQLLTETNCGEINNIQDLKALIETAASLYFPEEHKYEIRVVDDDTLLGRVLQCYVYKMVSAAGTTEIHQCAGKTRFESWLKAANLNGEVLNDKNTNNCNGRCEFIFKIRWKKAAVVPAVAPGGHP